MTRYHGHRTRKCVAIGQTYLFETMVVMIILVVCLSCVSGETIVITYRTGNSQPEEGDSNYQLECLIINLGSPAYAWSKDDNLLFWSTGTEITDLDMNREYTIQELYSNPTTRFILTFTDVRNHHSGIYKCFTATGNIQNFNVVQSSAVSVTVVPGPFTPSVTDAPRPTFPQELYFPSREWPKCYPQNAIKALIYSHINITCVSTPGNPMVEVNIYDPSNGQMIPNSDSIIIKSTNRIERIYTYQVVPTDNMDQFYCQIIDGIGMYRRCTMGKTEIGLFQYDRIETIEGAPFTLFQCLAGSSNSIHWSTEPPIELSRLYIIGDVLRINDVDMTDNGTIVICRVDGYNLLDQILLIVIPIDTLTILTSESSPYIPSISSLVSNKAASTTSPFDSTSITFTTQNTTSEGLPIIVIAAIGGGVCLGILFVGGLVLGIFCYYKKLNRHNNHKEESANTRNPTTNLDKVNIISNPKDSANSQNSNSANVTMVTYNSHRFASSTTQSSDESYTDLQLTDVHRSQYVSLKKSEAAGPSLDYVNVNLQRNEEPTYEVNIRSNPKDPANHHNFNSTNVTMVTDHSHRFAPSTTQSNDESYTDLQLTDVHRSQYASLKKPDIAGSNRDYVNVNPQRDQEPVYEVHIEGNMYNQQ